MALLQNITTWIKIAIPSFLSVNKTKILLRDNIREDIVDIATKELNEKEKTELRAEYDDVMPQMEEEVKSNGFFRRLGRGISNGFSKSLDFIISNGVVRAAVLVMSLGAAFFSPFGLTIGLSIFAATLTLTVSQYLVDGYQLKKLRNLQNENDLIKDIAKTHIQLHQELTIQPELQAVLIKNKDDMRCLGDLRIDSNSLKLININEYKIKDIKQHKSSYAISSVKGVGDTLLDNSISLMSLVQMGLNAINPLIFIPSIVSLALDIVVGARTRQVRDQERVRMQNDMETNKVLYDLDFTIGKGSDYLKRMNVCRKFELEAVQEIKEKLPDIRQQSVIDILVKDGTKYSDIKDSTTLNKIHEMQKRMHEISQVEQQIIVTKIDIDNIKDAINARKIIERNLKTQQEEQRKLEEKPELTKKEKKQLNKITKHIITLEDKLKEDIKTLVLDSNISGKYISISEAELQSKLNELKDGNSDQSLKILENKLMNKKTETIQYYAQGTESNIIERINKRTEENVQEQFNDLIKNKVQREQEIIDRAQQYKLLHNPNKGTFRNAAELATTFSYKEANEKIAPRAKLTDHRHYITGKIGLNTEEIRKKINSEINIKENLKVMKEELQNISPSTNNSNDIENSATPIKRIVNAGPAEQDIKYHSNENAKSNVITDVIENRKNQQHEPKRKLTESIRVNKSDRESGNILL